MSRTLEAAGGDGLARSCEPGEWVEGRGPVAGVELFRARFHGVAYSMHRHDTYAVGVTDAGVQAFHYRGRAEVSLPGQVVVLHPDEAHDGGAATDRWFGYRIVYLDPARIAAAVETLVGRPAPLPFVREPVVDAPGLAGAVADAFGAAAEPLALDALVLRLAEGLRACGGGGDRLPCRVDVSAVARGREFLDHRAAVVRSSEVEAVTGLSRYEFARQFRARYGTTPYRYSVMRRLDGARRRLREGAPLADLALAAGFADQPHFTRTFKSAFGMTPGRYAGLCGPDRSAAPLRTTAAR